MNLSCTIVGSSSEESSLDSLLSSGRLNLEKPESEQNDEMAKKAKKTAQTNNSNHVEKDKVAAKKSRGSTTSEISQYSSGRPKRQMSQETTEKNRRLYQQGLNANFDDQESLSDVNAVAMTKSAKKTQISDPTTNSTKTPKRRRKNNVEVDTALQATSSTPPLKISLPTAPIKGKSKTANSNYDNVKMNLPANVSKRLKEFFNSDEAQRLSIAGVEYDGFNIEIRIAEDNEDEIMQTAGESSPGKETESNENSNNEERQTSEVSPSTSLAVTRVDANTSEQSEVEEGEITRQTDADETVVVNETMQNDNAHKTKKQRSDESPSTSLAATRVNDNAPSNKADQAITRIPKGFKSLVQNTLKNVVKEYSIGNFEAQFIELMKKEEMQDMLQTVMAKELKNLITQNEGAVLSTILQRYFLGMESSDDSSDELEKK